MSIIALWSAPRSRSTAFFRMMVARGDCQCVHEPFSTRAEHGTVTLDGEDVRTERDILRRLRVLGASRTVFFKDTTDERYDAVLDDEGFLTTDAQHTFLIRHPAQTIPSYFALNPGVRCEQIGLETLHELFLRVWKLTGTRPLVVDADDLVAAPRAVIEHYCKALSLPFVSSALEWSPGERPEWAATARWHRDVSETRGFEQRAPVHGVRIEDHPQLVTYLEHHLPFYEAMHTHASQSLPVHSQPA